MSGGVLHIDSEKSWRGGQQQAFYLYKGFLDAGFKSHFVCRKGSKMADRLKENGLAFTELPLKGEFDLFSARQIAKYCKKNGLEVLYAHSSHALAIAILTKILMQDLKITGVRRVDFKIGGNPLSRYKYSSKMVNKIVCISEAIKNVMVDCGIRDDMLEVIRSGIDLQKFANVRENGLRDELGIPENKIIAGTVAAFAGHKDYPNFINAAERVIRTNKDIIFVAAGDGPLFEEMKEMIRDKGLSKDIILTGYRNDVGRFLKMFDIFILASKKEGLGTSIADAMSVGLPVIGTNAGGIPEVISDGVNGYVVPAKDHKKLADAVLKLAKDENLRNIFGKRSMELVKDFDINNTVEKNIDLVKRLMHNA